MRHTALFAAALVLASGAAGIQPAEVENTTLRLEVNTSEVFRSGLQTTPGEYQPSDYPYLSSSKPETLVPYGDTTELTNIYMPDGLVAYYPLDETTGNTANDITTTHPNNDGKHRNFDGNELGVEGNISTAYKFDGNNDYVDAGKRPELDLSSPRFSEGFTMSAWVRPRKVGDRIAFFTVADGVSGNQWQAYLAYSRKSEQRFFFSTRSDGSQPDIKSADLYPTDQWYLVTGVWNGQKDILYVNGKKQAEATIGQPDNTDKNTVHIGRFPGFTHFKGSVDEVRLYSRSLSQKEVQKLYNYQKKDQPGTEQISATVTSGGFILTNTKGGTPSIESQTEAVNSRTLLSQVSPSFGFQQTNTPPTTQAVYRSPYNLTGDSFSSASSGISLRSTKGLGENATVSVKPVG